MNKTLLSKSKTIGRIATLAIALLTLSSTTFADNDHRRGGYNHGNQRWNNHSASRNWNRYDRHRNSGFDGGSFFGGVVLGSVLSSNYSRPSYSHAGVYYERPWRSYRFSRPLRSSYGYFNSSYYEPYRVTRPRSTVVYSTVVNPAPIVVTAPQISATPTRRLLLDLEGRCFDVTTDEQGVERRLQLEDQACAF